MGDAETVEITAEDVGTIDAAELEPAALAAKLTHTIGVAASNGRAAARAGQWDAVRALAADAKAAADALGALAAEQAQS